MPSYVDVFTGDIVQPVEVSYRAVALGADVVLTWPTLSETSGDVAARIMDVTPSAGGFTITMPPANQVGVGADALYRNLGTFQFEVLDNSGGSIGVLLPGEAKYIYVTANSTAAGVWGIFTFGTGTSGADAVALAGNGLEAIAGKLSSDWAPLIISTNQFITSDTRARVYEWTGGAGTFTLDSIATVTDGFWVAVRNRGSGLLTIAPTGSDTIDDGALLLLNPGDSTFLVASGGDFNWATVGLGRNPEFVFSVLTVNLAAGGLIPISSSAAESKIVNLQGTPAATTSVNFPPVASVYWVANNTTGPETVFLGIDGVANFQVQINQGEKLEVVVTGTNIYPATDFFISISLDDLTDVTITLPTLDQVLRFNGFVWVNGMTTSASASSGVTFFLDETTIIPAGAGPQTFPLKTLLRVPSAAGETTNAATVNTGASATLPIASYRSTTDIGGSQIDGGVWDFNTYCTTSSATGINEIIINAYQVISGAGTVTITGAGTTRTATITGGVPFVAGDANADITLASYLETPAGQFQITAFTSSSNVDITTLATYTNEAAVAYHTSRKLFGATTGDINDLTVALQSVVSIQPAFSIDPTDRFGVRYFARTDSAVNRTLTLYVGGTQHASYVVSPLATRHNQLPDLQGGTFDEFFHLTSAEYTGSGTGVFARVNSPVLTTPNIGVATGSVSGNAGSATILQTTRTINGVGFNGSADIIIPAVAAGSLLGAPQYLTAGISFTTGPLTNFIFLKMGAGGGGSGGCAATGVGQQSSSGGGGSGSYAEKTFAVTPNTAYAYAIGAGGLAGAAGNNIGGTGGNTTFTAGSTVTCHGGVGGKGSAAGLAGAGGAGGAVSTNGDLNTAGRNGGSAHPTVPGTPEPGDGAGSMLGLYTIANNFLNSATVDVAIAGGLYGGGASGGGLGASQAQIAGAAGAQGIIIVQEIS